MKLISWLGPLAIVYGAYWVGPSALLAQDANLQFDVASLRPSGEAAKGTPRAAGRIRGGPGTNDPERITGERVPFQQLIMAAYGIERDQIKGPDWATTDDPQGAGRFDISAKVPPSATKEQLATMLQNLLKERFQLALHHTAVPFSGYALVVAKGGPKLNESAGPLGDSEQTKPTGGAVNLQTEKDGFPQLWPGRNMGGTFKDGVVRMRFRDYPLSDLTQQLSAALQAHLIDRTRLDAKYDFTLEFTVPENGFSVELGATLPLAPGQMAPFRKEGPDAGQLDSLPIVSAAMEKQLGLKLEAAKIAVDTLVIDHVEKTPTEN
jgi:uncharacterized protein (TIGR03435 family)